MTIRDYPELFDYVVQKTGNQVGTAGAVTFVDSPWFISFNAALQPVDPEQPDNVQVLWFYGLHANEHGTAVKKPMNECSGEEILKEFLYYCGLEDKYDEIREHCIVIPTVMPYITSQFMPRGRKDRPEIIPKGSGNLAFIGQFVELPGDVVFTVETSVRTAMTAVYRMTHLDRPVDPVFEGQYDIRMLKAGMLTMTGKDRLELSDLPKVNPLKLREELEKIVDQINAIPAVPEAYPDKWMNR
jgi:oleate hydratase